MFLNKINGLINSPTFDSFTINFTICYITMAFSIQNLLIQSKLHQLENKIILICEHFN